MLLGLSHIELKGMSKKIQKIKFIVFSTFFSFQSLFTKESPCKQWYFTQLTLTTPLVAKGN